MSEGESEPSEEVETDPSLMLDSEMYISDDEDQIERIKRWAVGVWTDLNLWAKLRYLNFRIWLGKRRQATSERIEEPAPESPDESAVLDEVEIPPIPTFGVPDRIEDEQESVPIPDSGYVIRDRHSGGDSIADEVYTFQPSISSFQSKFVVPRLVRSLDILYGITIIAIACAVFDRINDLGIYPGWSDFFTHFISDRYLQSYEGTLLPEFLRGSIVFLFLLLSGVYFLLGGRAKKGMFFLFMSIFSSIILRIYPIWFAGWETEDYLPLIVDLLLGILLLVSCSIPGFSRGLFEQPKYILESVNVDALIEQEYTESIPEELPDILGLDSIGETMPGFDVARPIPPKRRQPGSYSLYELLFLVLAMALWPIAVTGHILLALEIPTRAGTWTMEEFGVKALTPLYLLAIICSYLVLGMDKDARSGEVYAKEKAAYHADMDQYLALKQAYYEFKAAELTGNSEE